MDVFEALYTQEHDFKTIVVDSLDVIEEMITLKVCTENRYTDISKGAYGAGYQARTAVWANFFKCLDCLRDKGMTIILIAHAAVVKVADPLSRNTTNRVSTFTKLNPSQGCRMV